ncbi:hypothetical protein VIGAN_01213000 [Vigna angularis var. angularis]|uniref:Uncharacterized protein n=1 Tax=Vigna angularis var. angularis TaxID=157739 RepID=A0A0S3R1I3_PHAAN|nr:hypothetical protein VIGAN_01213000 [Vigna angularis var. angularis]
MLLLDRGILFPSQLDPLGPGRAKLIPMGPCCQRILLVPSQPLARRWTMCAYWMQKTRRGSVSKAQKKSAPSIPA